MEVETRLLLALIGGAFIFAPLCMVIAKMKNRSQLKWAGIGFLFGPLGTIVAAVVPKADRGWRTWSGRREFLTLEDFLIEERARLDAFEEDLRSEKEAEGGEPTEELVMRASDWDAEYRAYDPQWN